MNDTAQVLVAQMVAAGEWPDPELLRAILNQGEAAIEPLLDVIHQPGHGWPAEAKIYYAAYLLGSVGGPSVIPDMIAMFYRYDHDTLEAVSEALGQMGPEVVEPALEVICDESLRWWPRAAAAGAAIDAAGDDPVLRSRIAVALRELLAGYLARADTLKDDDFQMATALVSNLARLADPEARTLINAAFEAGIIEEWVIGLEDVEHSYRQGGERSRRSDPQAWLREYEWQYQHYRSRE